MVIKSYEVASRATIDAGLRTRLEAAVERHADGARRALMFVGTAAGEFQPDSGRGRAPRYVDSWHGALIGDLFETGRRGW
ncbi:MAG: hypothetical protein ABS79_01225 [Planctomycetes bacterium SCN 63-9]|nr:MAG: hypothetical protein ABS79_01225 [Planctomycetes bacterium SCN 63-9]